MTVIKHSRRNVAVKFYGPDTGIISDNDFIHSDEAGRELEVVSYAYPATDSPAKNRGMLQEALSAGGRVVISGMYTIDRTLIGPQGGGLYVDMDPDAGIQCTGGVGYPVFTTYAYSQRASAAAVTLTWSSGLSMTVDFGAAAHGLSVGNSVWVQNASPSMFNGLFYVLTVTDAFKVVVLLWRVPTAAVSGSPVALAADDDIFWDGGILDYNYPAQSGPSTELLRPSLIMGLCANTHIRNLTMKNAFGYAVYWGGNRDCFADQIRLDNCHKDAQKVIGPARNVHLKGTYGPCADDGISFQPKIQTAFINYRFSYGDIINCVCEDTNLDLSQSGTSEVVCYPSVSEYGQALVLNTGGTTTAGQGVAIFGDDTLSNVWDSLEVDGITTAAAYGFRRMGAGTIVNHLVVRNNNFNPLTTGTSHAVSFDASTTGYHSELESIVNRSDYTSAVYVHDFLGTDTLIETTGFLQAGSSARWAQIGTGSAVGVLRVKGLNQKTGDNCVVIPANVTGKVIYEDCDINSLAVFTSTGGGTNDVVFTNNRFTNATNGVVRTTSTPTLKVRGSGNTLTAGVWNVAATGSQTMDWITAEVQVPGTYATSAGGLAEGTNSATVKTVNTITYLIGGIWYSKGATDNIAIAAATAQAVSTTRIYVVQLDTAGAFTTVQGPAGGTFPPATAGKCPVGAFKVVTDSGTTYTPGTTDNGAAGLTVTYVDISQIPQAMTM